MVVHDRHQRRGIVDEAAPLINYSRARILYSFSLEPDDLTEAVFSSSICVNRIFTSLTGRHIHGPRG